MAPKRSLSLTAGQAQQVKLNKANAILLELEALPYEPDKMVAMNCASAFQRGANAEQKRFPSLDVLLTVTGILLERYLNGAQRAGTRTMHACTPVQPLSFWTIL
eukprot:scaffold150479_cov21-Tisochrysis_lutea.AAC.1